MKKITRLQDYFGTQSRSHASTSSEVAEEPMLLKGQFGRKSDFTPPAPWEVIKKNLFFIVASNNFGNTGIDRVDRAHHELWFETSEFLSHHMEDLTNKVSVEESRDFAHALAKWSWVAPVHIEGASQKISEVEDKFFTHFSGQDHERALKAYRVRLQSQKLNLQRSQERESSTKQSDEAALYSPWKDKKDKGIWDTSSAPAL